MRKRVDILSMEHGSTQRGAKGVFGEAVVEDRKASYLIRFSRLEGERYWVADEMIDGDNPIFSHAPGERGNTRYEISGAVARALDDRYENELQESTT